MIYFVQMCCPTGFIKIGTAGDIGRRLSVLRCSSPYDVKLLRTLEGGPAEEAQLHRKFRHCCERNEWFRPEPNLLAFIASQERNDAMGLPRIALADASFQKRFLRLQRTIARRRDRGIEPARPAV